MAKKKTMDDYMKIGAEMRLLKEAGSKLWMDSYQILPAKDRYQLDRVLNRIYEICSRAEDQMFHDHPEVSNDCLTVFYGGLKGEPHNPVDAAVRERARQAVGELFGPAGKMPCTCSVEREKK